MKHPVTPAEAVAQIPDGASLMIGGFMGCGVPYTLIEAIIAAGKKNLTIISNDNDRVNQGIGRLIHEGCVSHVITSHIGLNPETQKGMIDGTIQVDLVPQGTLAEQIRSAGHGLGGVLTKTALGTIAAKAGETVHLNGEDWLYMPPLKADFAVIHADQADHIGNLSYRLTAQNFSPLMALAADHVICEVREFVPVGIIPPDLVKTPGIVVDTLVPAITNKPIKPAQ
ncbi:CoA transferase subunit A [Beijerinckia indica]|uniref:3-oxoacid CoA-transferase, A subunit n=1 Tax=Beijerinckia indica subsp. indica (strain ATCC 9039 / DSM 1715 / NCIMB 8712) TaxID=395963 RepID=B2ID68_BEII9|nr:3-oxoacid CoA-transferase subunit A [Beijerinckia indica]ACB96833.1 3-oxoacid CoA-transferase, A subunit [Beijerinckia indica subsp. indica ATCC 9039]